jgi:hypothetical protein
LEQAAFFNITLSAPKSKVGLTKISLLGVEVQHNRVEAKRSYLDSIAALGRPEVCHELRQLIGMTQWVLRHLPDAVTPVQVLAGAIPSGASKSTRIQWTEARLTRCARRWRIRARWWHSIRRVRWFVTDVGGGAVLGHPNTAKCDVDVVDMLSHKFSDAETRYPVAERELLMLRIAALAGHWHHRLRGRTVYWVTDSKPMAQLLRSARLSNRQRLRTTVLDLIGLRIVCVYVRGEVNQAADVLSRLAVENAEAAIDEDAPLEVAGQVTVGAIIAQWTRGAPEVQLLPLEAMLEDDEEASAGAGPCEQEVRADASLESLVRAADAACCIDGLEPRWEGGRLVVRAEEGGDALAHRNVRLVMPTEYCTPTLSTLHARGLFSAAKLMAAVEASFYWPSLRADVRTLVETCDECRKASHVSRVANNFGDSESGSGADERVFAAREGYQIDTLHLREFNMRLLVVTCLFTDFTLLLPVEEGTAAEAARVVTGAFEVLGTPRFVKTDGGPEFGGAFVECMREFGVRLVRGTPYNSDGQARVERKIGEVNAIVRRLVMHARSSGSPSVAVIVRQAQWALNAVPLPKVERERLCGAMTRYGAFYGSEPRIVLSKWRVVEDEEEAPVGVGGRCGTTGTAQGATATRLPCGLGRRACVVGSCGVCARSGGTRCVQGAVRWRNAGAAQCHVPLQLVGRGEGAVRCSPGQGGRSGRSGSCSTHCGGELAGPFGGGEVSGVHRHGGPVRGDHQVRRGAADCAWSVVDAGCWVASAFEADSSAVCLESLWR